MSTETFTITFDDEAFVSAEACLMYHEGTDFPKEYEDGFYVLAEMFSKRSKTLTFTKYVWDCFDAFMSYHEDGVPERYLDGLDTVFAILDEPEAFAV